MEQNNGERKLGIRYSEAFKMALVRELEEGGQRRELRPGSERLGGFDCAVKYCQHRNHKENMKAESERGSVLTNSLPLN